MLFNIHCGPRVFFLQIKESVNLGMRLAVLKFVLALSFSFMQVLVVIAHFFFWEH